MALYPISQEGVQSFEQLKTDLQAQVKDIEERGEKLRATVKGHDQSLGYLSEKIYEYLGEIEKLEKANSISVGTVIKLIEKRIARIEDLLRQGL